MSDQFRFIKFQKSKSRFSKYDAIIEDIKTRRRQKVPFGDKRHEQYKDTTGLKIYSYHLFCLKKSVADSRNAVHGCIPRTYVSMNQWFEIKNTMNNIAQPKYIYVVNDRT